MLDLFRFAIIIIHAIRPLHAHSFGTRTHYVYKCIMHAAIDSIPYGRIYTIYDAADTPYKII